MTLEQMRAYVATFVEVPATQIPNEQIDAFLRQAHNLIAMLHDWPWLRAPDTVLTVQPDDGFTTVAQAKRVSQVTLRSPRKVLPYLGHETAVRYYGGQTADVPRAWSVIGAEGGNYALYLWPSPRAAEQVTVAAVARPAAWPTSDTDADAPPGQQHSGRPASGEFAVPQELHLPIADFALGTALIQKGDAQAGLLMRQSATDTVEAVWRAVTPTNLAPFLAGVDSIQPGPRPLTDPSDVVAVPRQ